MQRLESGPQSADIFRGDKMICNLLFNLTTMDVVVWERVGTGIPHLFAQ